LPLAKRLGVKHNKHSSRGKGAGVLAKSSAFAGRFLGGCLAGAVVLAALIMLLSPAQARNVPGSASAVQPLIDHAVASSLLDNVLLSARSSAAFDRCQDYLRIHEQRAGEPTRPCEWGISAGAGVRHIEDSPNDYDFEFTSAFGNIAIAHRLSPSTALIGALIAETGDGRLFYNAGKFENVGVGGLAGAIVSLDSGLALSVLGGAEWLNYETTRTNGLYHGEFDAIRFLLDAQAQGYYATGNLFAQYSGGMRFIHQENESYVEQVGGADFADVPSTSFTALTGIGDLKLGTRIDGISPYVQATGYVNLLDKTDLGGLTGPLPDVATITGRFGVGIDMAFVGGKLSLTTGVFVADGDYQGFDGGLAFFKAF
jgi:hypothetical protein